MNLTEQPESPQNHTPPASPAPLVTKGTEHVPAVKRWLPRLIIGAILISLTPSLFALFGENYRELGETIRNYANFFLLAGLLIIILKTLSEKK